MQRNKWRVISRTGTVVVTLGLMSGSVAFGADQPGSEHGSSIPPSRVIAGRPLHSPPKLDAADAYKSVNAFITWAGESVVEEQNDARRVLASAAKKPELVQAFTEAILEAHKSGDTSRALVGLGLLGEMRTYDGAKFLAEFVRMPLPTKGTVIEGELQEEAQQARLQAKAIAGVAYLRDPEFDREVAYQAGNHPSVIVRAEAISAYLWNRGDSLEARKALEPFVRKEERLFLDRVRRVSGEGAESFNRKLTAYLKAHPEVQAPNPVRKDPRPPEEKPNTFDVTPPKF
ncbi:hypothetical protein [Corallococcus aberystwythensis]|uniref:HEAT repeat domain-containing protein n=1 Tax=Corallococcus aberystwythensis TaxID=2316722 RepID=A0A3A8QZV7_9BACT|nr:hypothetical protein [Corallococcus aberystwythensis]RKH74326.1 hypothetical protein D7W81_01865 [Corallococcus aberystwythensis]